MKNKIKIAGHYIPSKDKVARELEGFRAAVKLNKKEFAAFMGTTGQNYNHILAGNSFPNLEMISILLQKGFNIKKILIV